MDNTNTSGTPDLLSAVSVLTGTPATRQEPNVGRRDCRRCEGCGIVGVDRGPGAQPDSETCPSCDGLGSYEGGPVRLTDEDGIDGPFERAMDKAIAHDQLQRIPVVTSAVPLIEYEVKPRTAGASWHRYRCTCGRVGTWLTSEEKVHANATLHIEWHSDGAP